MVSNISFYNDLSPEDDRDLQLWLMYFEEAVFNALTQIRRWKRNKNTWDLQMFFVAVRCIKEATDGLMKLGFFCGNEPDVWRAMDKFRKYFEGTDLKDLRDESIHRDELYNPNKQKRQLQKGHLILLGVLKINSGEYTYQFGTKEIKVLETFSEVKALQKEIRAILDKKAKKYSDPMVYKKGMFGWRDFKTFLIKR